MTISETQIYNICESILKHHSPVGNCYHISTKIANSFEENIPEIDPRNIRVKEIRFGTPSQQHYILTIPMSIYEHSSDDGWLIIDPTISQFTNEIKEAGLVKFSIGSPNKTPDIGIYPPNHQKRINWYGHKDAFSRNEDIKFETE